MPGGFSSVADLKVIVDANAEKFHSGLQGVVKAVEDVGAKGSSSFGPLQGIIDMVGSAALTARGKFQLLATGLETGLALYQQFATEGRAAAEVLGVTSEYDKLIDTINDLGLNIKDGAIGAFFALQSAGQETASSMMSFAGSTDQANASSESFAATLLNRVTSALDTARLQLRLWNSDLASNAGQINTTVNLLDDRLQKLRTDLAKVQSGESPRTATIMSRGGIASTRDNEMLLLEEINRLEASRNDLLAKRTSLPGQDWVDGTVTSRNLLNDEIEALQRRNAVLGMSAGAAAEYNAINKGVADAERQKLEMTDEQIASIRAEAAEIGRLTQAADNYAKSEREAQAAKQRSQQTERQESSSFSGADRELLSLSQRQRALSLTAAEAAELNMQERLRQQLTSAGIPIDAAQEIRIKAIAAAYGQQTEALQLAMEGQREMQEFANVFASSMSSAFSQWTRGAELDVKSMVSSILADLAQLAMRKQVLEPLFGGGSGNSSGGLIGSLFSGVFGGARAEGGPVESGMTYLVGERGPELFRPTQSGSIIPNGAGGGANIQIVTNIDARGATPDAIAMLEQKMAARDARLEGDVTRIIGNVRDRGIA